MIWSLVENVRTEKDLGGYLILCPRCIDKEVDVLTIVVLEPIVKLCLSISFCKTYIFLVQWAKPPFLRSSVLSSASHGTAGEPCEPLLDFWLSSTFWPVPFVPLTSLTALFQPQGLQDGHNISVKSSLL